MGHSVPRRHVNKVNDVFLSIYKRCRITITMGDIRDKNEIVVVVNLVHECCLSFVVRYRRQLYASDGGNSRSW